MRISIPETSSARKHSAVIQWVRRTTAVCRRLPVGLVCPVVMVAVTAIRLCYHRLPIDGESPTGKSLYPNHMQRRIFLANSLTTLSTSSALAAFRGRPVNKRERMRQWLAGKPDPHYTPAAFFLHFAPEYKTGSAAAQRHLEFFRQTDMDFVKVQFEQTYERQEFLQKPAHWSKLELRKRD